MHDLLDAYPPLLYIMFLVYYCSLNDTGILYITLTGLPFCFPGVQFGMLLTTLSASKSREGSFFITTSVFVVLPSFSTMNLTTTLP